MAKKKVISKVPQVDEKEKASKVIEKIPEESDVDAFDAEDVPKEVAELSELEQEIAGAEGDFEEEIQEERYYTIPLAKRGYERTPRWRATKKAVKVIREFLTRHMKPEGEVYLSPELNERVWENGLSNPPRKVRVRVTKSIDGIVRAYLA